MCIRDRNNDSQHGADSDTFELQLVRESLQATIARPLFIGATPSTPFLIQTLVGEELFKQKHKYTHIKRQATALLETWFRQNPTGELSEADRRHILAQAK